jgi:CubicO group peptidase (beta-lactamase class C family)
MKKITLLLIVAGIFVNAFPQDGNPSFVRDSLDIYVERALREWQIPGVAVCIVKDGKAVVMKSYGVKELGATEKVDENTLFMIGSNSKAFTATALAMLQEEKKLSLDDPVKKYLADFTLHDAWVTKEANLRDLLCHRLGYETFQGDFMFFDSDLTTQQVREKWAKVEPLYSFRGQWGYTNAAFMTAGEVIPKASGKTWAAYLQEKIFQPLGMTRTLALSKDITAATNKATAHTVAQGVLKKIPYGNIDNLAAAGSISSSISDMSHWVMAQLDNGKYDGKTAIPAAAIAQTWYPHSIMGNGGHRFNRAHFALYGLGWMLQEYSGRKIVSHTGGVNGFVTSVTLIPEEKLGIIVLTNTDANSFYESLKWELMDAYLQLPYRNYSNLHLGFYKNQQKNEAGWLAKKKDSIAKNPAPALSLASFAGDYTHSIYGRMTLKVDGNKLVASFEHHKGRLATLEALGGNRFLATFNDPLYGIKEWPFTIENGKVKSVRVTVADFVEFTPYEFYKK